RSLNGRYPSSSWRAQHIAQIEGPTPGEHYPKDVSWCGVRGMAGQVREWCADWYDPTYYQHSSRFNPQDSDQHCPECTSLRVLRGGSWSSYAVTSRGAQRLYYPPDRQDSNDHWLRPVLS
ncbi:MAG TPA: SUMF1/EgtB/PvdO family nonheme iron enzyme, partial [Ktedonobacteraceae bacterium]|nr:SUMF1/EgtB/PvdO family nonheme iron enzyme [Ktedonobacteraceae bacterium]